MLRIDKSPHDLTQLSLNPRGLDKVQRRYWERWNEQNKEAVAAYNARVEHEGLPLAKYRTFMKGR